MPNRRQRLMIHAGQPRYHRVEKLLVLQVAVQRTLVLSAGFPRFATTTSTIVRNSDTDSMCRFAGTTALQ
jgi:hypothetical protein